MKRLLFIITLIITMTIFGHGEVSAAQQHEDALHKIEHKSNRQEAILSDVSVTYRVCNGRPQRLIPNWNLPHSKHNNRVFNSYLFFHSRLKQFLGKPRGETAPFHFDVACKYYIICLRHLLC